MIMEISFQQIISFSIVLDSYEKIHNLPVQSRKGTSSVLPGLVHLPTR